MEHSDERVETAHHRLDPPRVLRIPEEVEPDLQETHSK